MGPKSPRRPHSSGDPLSLSTRLVGLVPLVTALVASIASAQLGALPSAASSTAQGAPRSDRPALTDVISVYDDALAAGWQNWSWSTAVDTDNASPALGDDPATARSISTTHTVAWAGLFLHNDEAFGVEPGGEVRFSLHGGATGGQAVAFLAYDANSQASAPIVLSPPPADGWAFYSIPLESLGLATCGGFVWQEFSGAAQPGYFVDQIRVLSPAPGLELLPDGGGLPSGPGMSLDPAAPGTPISEWIYGTNALEPALVAELSVPVRRLGGNHITRYNWQLDVSNRGSDWYFENIPYPVADVSALPSGSSTDVFVEQGAGAGAQTIVSVPLIGWTPRSRDVAGGFSVSKYGAQQDTDPFQPDLGNGVLSNGNLVLGNDPLDTSVPISPPFVEQWVEHLVSRYGLADQGGVAFYELDNEPMLWNLTHRDVFPMPASYDLVRDRGLLYGAAVKAADPSARLIGPSVWGWTAYFYSALDWEPGGAWYLAPADRIAHGGVPFLEWYLGEMAVYEQATSVRLLDYLDVHYYPAGTGIVAGGLDAGTRSLRLRSTRALWDPTYVDESWIAEPVRLLPRLKQMIADNYPGTGLSIGEYTWGALQDMNGALAQADVLGIFGREGVDVATLFAFIEDTDPGTFAFRMFRNYDGLGGRFGELSLPAVSADPDSVSIFAARREDGAVTILLLNKTAIQLKCSVDLLSDLPAGPVQQWTYSSAEPGQIVRRPDLPGVGAGLKVSLSAESIHLLVSSH
jgi:hypothetical protein